MRRGEALLKIRQRVGPVGDVRGSHGACKIGRVVEGTFTLLGQGPSWEAAWADCKNTLKELL